MAGELTGGLVVGLVSRTACQLSVISQPQLAVNVQTSRRRNGLGCSACLDYYPAFPDDASRSATTSRRDAFAQGWSAMAATFKRKNGDDNHGWCSPTARALSHVCRKRWRKLDLAAGSPNPPMRINSASGVYVVPCCTLLYALILQYQRLR